MLEAPYSIYIAGKITGESEEDYMTRFMAAQQALSREFPDAQIFNPAVTLHDIGERVDHDTMIDICITHMDRCDGFAYLPDWTESRGAQIEMDHALRTGKIMIQLVEKSDKYEVRRL